MLLNAFVDSTRTSNDLFIGQNVFTTENAHYRDRLCYFSPQS